MRAVSGDLAAKEIVRLLDLVPHPEGGWYRETHRGAAGTAIYFLLEADQVSHWHRIDADETWHWYAGGALALTLSPPSGQGARTVALGPDLRAGQRPQAVVPANNWQAAESLGAWTLCGCTVAPAFEFENFELAPADWRPAM